MTRALKASLLAAATLILAGCGDALTEQNLQKVKSGMSPAEVEAILGRPTESTSAAGTHKNITGSIQNSVWRSGDGKRVISVMYLNGKAALISSSGV